MNIKILDSWLRDYLKTEAKPKELAEKLSLTSVSVEKVEKIDNDFLYDIEITTNRPDLFSVIGLSRESAAILPQFGIKAEFISPKLDKAPSGTQQPIKIINDPKLTNRVLAIAMDIEIHDSKKEIKERLEKSDIRSLNNVIDITNYVMRVTGHPTHVFDFDRLNTKSLTIREAKKGEQIETLDDKIYALKGGEIVATNDAGEIVDLLGIMGLSNSVVTKDTKRILFFINNNDSMHIRKASMELGIRTEAANLNEKNLDPEIAIEALNLGVDLFKKHASAKNISSVLDIYPNKPKTEIINVSTDKINKLIGVNVNLKKSLDALEALGFKTKSKLNKLEVEVPSFRQNDIKIEEDVIEEIARIYGYHNLPSIIPPISSNVKSYNLMNQFYWEDKLKQAMKYFGFTETYTYSFVSESMYEGPLTEAVEILNPLTSDFVYLRNTLVPSLLEVIDNNKKQNDIKIFEVANIYIKRPGSLPEEKPLFSGVIKNEQVNFFNIKGILEQTLSDLGIQNIIFKKSKKGGIGSSVYINNDYLGEIEILDVGLIDFELDFKLILKYATNKREFKEFAKYPPIVEDLTILTKENTNTEELINTIKSQSKIINEVSLKSTFEDAKTFHIIYQDFEKNLTNQEVSQIREKIISALKKNFNASIK